MSGGENTTPMIERYEELRQLGEQAFVAGELRHAADLFLQAEEAARDGGRDDLADRVYCSRFAMLLELDEASAETPRLKQLILSSSDDRARWLATYYTAVSYDLDDEVDKALVYAQRACSAATAFDDPAMTARCANLSGTLALRTSSFEQAETAYREAIEAHAALDGYHRSYGALALDNLGYVLMCTDRLSEGVRLCEEALEQADEAEGDNCAAQILQDLCYGYILEDELTSAQDCGERALDLAVDSSDGLVVKNVLFLLSEIAIRRGDMFRARRFLRELAEYYPEVGVSEEIIEVFLATDLTSVVNLRG